MKREEIREKERIIKEKAKNVVKWMSGLIALGILVFVTMSVVIEGNRISGLRDSKNAINQMSLGEKLPWTSFENKTLAVVDCGVENKYFVTKLNKVFPTDKIENCTVYLAQDVEIKASYYPLRDIGRIIIEPSE
ncbi:hypothetical protein KBB42_02385 [Candidatus Dojkabacteria bacterium]|nr:hypothetical protein [Candidatus Dojkabacteria bacterium]